MKRVLSRTAALVAAAATLPAGCSTGPHDAVVTTAGGRVRGVTQDAVVSFKGIPYAASTTGANRWRPPRPAAPWSGIRNADHYAPVCPQFESDALWFEIDEMSEDCLALNVWTPAPDPSARLPVMVWIHGGGYVNGAGSVARINSPALAREGVVLVTLNYRLSLFGFFAHPALSRQQAGEPLANYGLMDIVAALRWVRDNVAAFGGDPGNVTVFGESAGGALVNYLMIMPPAAGLFRQAISQSASVGLAPDAKLSQRSGFQPPAERVGMSIAKRAGVADSPDPVAALRAIPMEDLVALLRPMDRFTPVIDGDWIPGHVGLLFAAGRQHDVPYLTGGVSWEARLGRQIGGGLSPDIMAKVVPDADKARLYPGLSGTALADEIFGDLIIHAQSLYLGDQMQNVTAPVWEYYFSYVADERRATQPGVAHADDIAFVMQTLDADLAAPTERDRAVSDIVSHYWLQFARTGDPNAPGLPFWPAYTSQHPAVLEIGDAIRVHEPFRPERMNYFKRRGRDKLDEAR